LKKFGLSLILSLVLPFTLALPVFAYDSSVDLVEKDSEWGIVEDGASGTVYYDSVGGAFDYQLEAEGLDATSYDLIYYADPWAGENGFSLGTFDADEGGYISSPDTSYFIGDDLPLEIDESEDGAKIWLVPSAYYAEGTGITSWQPDKFLFEHHLINYDYSPVEKEDTWNYWENTSELGVTIFAKWDEGPIAASGWDGELFSPDRVTRDNIIASASDSGYTVSVFIPAGTNLINTYRPSVLVTSFNVSLDGDDIEVSPQNLTLSQPCIMEITNPDGSTETITFLTVVGGDLVPDSVS